MFSFAKVLTTVSIVAAVANAIQVTSPTKYDTWTSPGTETVTWSSVSTDASTIAIILISFDQSYILDLTTNVTTSDGTLTVEGTYPVGTNYRVNIVRDATQTSSILAQSDYFNITQGAVTSSSATSSSTSSSASSATSSGTAPVTLSHSSVSAAITGSAALASASAASASAASASVLANSVPSSTKASSGSRVVPAVGLAIVGAVGAYFL